MTFYDEVLRELVAALGAAMFFGNLYALLRRRADAQRTPVKKGAARARGSARASGTARDGDLDQAPVARTLVYVVLGFVMMVAGIASLVVG
jgi:hypothetical protein